MGIDSLAEDGGARHLKRGQRMPDLDLPTTAGRLVNFSKLGGMAVVYCYPWTGGPGLPNPPNWDDIPGAHGSTAEIAGFRDLYDQFEEFELGVYGLSRQSTEYQREMVERLKVPFPILSDADGTFASAVKLPSFTAGNQIYCKRLSLILTQGVVETVFYPVPRPEKHARDVLRWFRREMRR